MARYLISWRSTFEEDKLEFLESTALGVGSSPTVEALFKAWELIRATARHSSGKRPLGRAEASTALN
jgi:hypothetical protein